MRMLRRTRRTCQPFLSKFNTSDRAPLWMVAQPREREARKMGFVQATKGRECHYTWFSRKTQKRVSSAKKKLFARSLIMRGLRYEGADFAMNSGVRVQGAALQFDHAGRDSTTSVSFSPTLCRGSSQPKHNTVPSSRVTIARPSLSPAKPHGTGVEGSACDHRRLPFFRSKATIFDLSAITIALPHTAMPTLSLHS
jgi:hypothetical protein